MKAISLIVMLSLLTGITARADDLFALAWSSSTGGGGPSSGPSEFTLAGSSVGQSAAGPSSSEEGEFTLTSGSWPLEILASLFRNPHLAVFQDGVSVTVTWDGDGATMRLERSDDLRFWTPVEPQPTSPFFQEPLAGQAYFRLSPP